MAESRHDAGPRRPPDAPAIRSVRRLEPNFRILHIISEGAYGVVYKALDLSARDLVALKYIKIDPMKWAEAGFPLSSIREIRALSTFRHPNIVRLREVVIDASGSRFYLVLDYAVMDLNQALSRAPQELQPIAAVKALLWQLLAAVAHLHSASLMHRDIKSPNILLGPDGQLYLADFGHAKSYFAQRAAPLTPNVVTIGYRSPELVFGDREYDTAIDMWSVGCILAEMLLGRPLIDTKTDIDQLIRLIEMFGVPNEANYGPVHHLKLVKHLNPTVAGTGLRSLFPMLDDAGFDLLTSLLCYSPRQRITAADALQHPWFATEPLPQRPCFDAAGLDEGGAAAHTATSAFVHAFPLEPLPTAANGHLSPVASRPTPSRGDGVRTGARTEDRGRRAAHREAGATALRHDDADDAREHRSKRDYGGPRDRDPCDHRSKRRARRHESPDEGSPEDFRRPASSHYSGTRKRDALDARTRDIPEERWGSPPRRRSHGRDSPHRWGSPGPSRRHGAPSPKPPPNASRHHTSRSGRPRSRYDDHDRHGGRSSYHRGSPEPRAGAYRSSHREDRTHSRRSLHDPDRRGRS